jgi:hypothetical protein
MKILHRAELLLVPVGTIYREFEPCVWSGEWMRFGGRCGENDWWESNLGPHFVAPGYWGLSDAPEALMKQLPTGSPEPWSFVIDDCEGREGCFAADALYLVLEAADIQLMIEQLQGGQQGEPTYAPIPD